MMRSTLVSYLLFAAMLIALAAVFLWVPTEKDDPGGNPLFLGQWSPSIYRPHCLLAHPDGRTLVNGGADDKELSLWDLRTAKRTVGLERTGGIICSAISPDGSRLCVAAKDGLGMYRFPCSGEEPLWDVMPGTTFCDAAFSRNGAMVGSVRGETVRKRFSPVGRNDPCPCGSGKKYKKCCVGLFD